MAYNKSDLVSKIAQKSNLTKAQAEAAVNAFQDVFVEAMQSGEGLKLTGLFSGGELAEEDMDELMLAIQKAYEIAKENNRKYARKDHTEKND